MTECEWEHHVYVSMWSETDDGSLQTAKTGKIKRLQFFVDFRIWTPMESGTIRKKNQQGWRFSTFFTEQFRRHYNLLKKQPEFGKDLRP